MLEYFHFILPILCLSIDGGLGLSILPLAALLTGTLLTIGIAVLLIVVLAIRKRRDPVSRNICDDKDKHLGKFTVFPSLIWFATFVIFQRLHLWVGVISFSLIRILTQNYFLSLSLCLFAGSCTYSSADRYCCFVARWIVFYCRTIKEWIWR